MKYLCSFLLILCQTFCYSQVTYSLYVRPTGSLGNQLANYWSIVKNSDLSHKAITKYPPHCTLTSFFVPEQDVDFYIEKMQLAVNDAKALYPLSITVNPSLRQREELDCITLTSQFLQALALAYARRANLDDGDAKGQPGDFPFHITLRNHIFKTPGKLERIQNFEAQIHLNASAGWTLYLYEQDEAGVLTPLATLPLI